MVTEGRHSRPGRIHHRSLRGRTRCLMVRPLPVIAVFTFNFATLPFDLVVWSADCLPGIQCRNTTDWPIHLRLDQALLILNCTRAFQNLFVPSPTFFPGLAYDATGTSRTPITTRTADLFEFGQARSTVISAAGGFPDFESHAKVAEQVVIFSDVFQENSADYAGKAPRSTRDHSSRRTVGVWP
jgi:hypothetical protein